jgi:hypothetical protein
LYFQQPNDKNILILLYLAARRTELGDGFV